LKFVKGGRDTKESLDTRGPLMQSCKRGAAVGNIPVTWTPFCLVWYSQRRECNNGTI